MNLNQIKSQGIAVELEARKRPRGQSQRPCNVCAHYFRPLTPFDRYCSVCKKGSELLKFSEWLPELDESIAEQVCA